MKRLLSISLALAAGAAVLGLHNVTLAQNDAKREQVARGKYIVENVAQCVQCHTPRDASGNLLQDRWLEGAPIPVQSPYPNSPWAERAPSIAGASNFGADNVKYLLETGTVKRTGRPPQAPMPPFRMTPEDADAVVAYLVSLGEAK